MWDVGNCLLSEILQKRGMTQSELAEKLNIHKQTINAYVHKRKTMSLKTAYNIAYILDCDATDLYEWKVSE